MKPSAMLAMIAKGLSFQSKHHQRLMYSDLALQSLSLNSYPPATVGKSRGKFKTRSRANRLKA